MNLIKNLGLYDRLLRTAIGIALIAAWYVGLLPNELAILLVSFTATIALITALFSFCPLYSLLGFSTCPVSPQEQPQAEKEEETML